MHKKKTQEEFEKEVYNLVGNEYTVLGKYIDALKKILIRHNNCNYEWNVQPSNFLEGQRCPVCSKNPKKVLKGVNDMWTTNPELAKLLADPEDGYRYTQNSSKKVNWKCNVCCNIVKGRIISSVNRYGLCCPICSDGIPYSEKFMYNLLKQLNISFEYQKKFDWCKYDLNNKQKYGIYDFYLLDYNCIIEIDGNLGHGNKNQITGQTSEETKIIDIIKDKLAINHNINIIRIDYRYNKNDKYSYIKNSMLMNKKFCDLINLSKVNWEKVDELSQKSLIKDVCLYKNQHPNTTACEIGKVFKINKSTVSTYLSKGSKLKWCKYSPTEEKTKGMLKSINKNSKKVICLTTNKIYNSIGEAGRDLNINSGHISSCCNHKRKSAGKLDDYTPIRWMYLNEYNKLKGVINN